MALPGADPITKLIEMVPLLVLFEASVLVAKLVERSVASRAASVCTLRGRNLGAQKSSGGSRCAESDPIRV